MKLLQAIMCVKLLYNAMRRGNAVHDADKLDSDYDDDDDDDKSSTRSHSSKRNKENYEHLQ